MNRLIVRLKYVFNFFIDIIIGGIFIIVYKFKFKLYDNILSFMDRI